MKKLLSGIFLALLVVFVALPAYAANIQIEVDGVFLASGMMPELRNSRTLVPVRIISEYLGATVSWSNSEVTLIKSDMQVTLKLNNSTAIKNGIEVPLDVKPYITNNRIMVPLRFLAEAFGCDVHYSNFTVTVNTEPLVIDGAKVKALQREYHMTMGGVVQEITGNAYIKGIYDVILENKGSKAEAPTSYSWMADIDTPGAYYKIGEFVFLDVDSNSIQRFDVYGLIEAHPAEMLAQYPKVLIHSAPANEWNLFNITAIHSINRLIESAATNGFLKIISNTVV